MSETVGRYDKLLDSGNASGFVAAVAFDRSVELPDENPVVAAEIARLRETRAGREIVWRRQPGSAGRLSDRTIGFAVATEDPSREKDDLTMLLFADGSTIIFEPRGTKDPVVVGDYKRLSDRTSGPLVLTSTAGTLGDMVSRVRENPARLAGAEYIDPLVTPGASIAEIRRRTLKRILPADSGKMAPGALAKVHIKP